MVADESKTVTRRRLLTGCGVAGASLLAGCTGGNGDGSKQTTDGKNGGTGTSETGGTTAQSGPYSVSMEPVGKVEFESVPKKWVANNGSWADMGVALGVEPPKAVWLTSRYHTQYYDEIPGVSVDASKMTDLYQDGVSKELFYELSADVHVIDPNFLMNRFKGWKQSDVDEISKRVGPFFGNSIFSHGYQWHKDYRYYSLYEAFGKLAKVFQRTDRYKALASLHDEFQTKLGSVVPSKKQKRPEVAILWASGNEPKSFSPYLISEGTSFKQWRDLKVRDALANTSVRDFHSNRGEVDFETLLEIDPDVLLLRGHEQQTKKEFQNTVVSFMESHTVGSKLTAVKNGDVYRGGPLYQGPITNLVVTERAAEQVYDVSKSLFDRKRVGDIVKGNL
ncbi:ABC transporter substrate-binding protein [Haladaptatus halobius]|uniref:ABC transporter substrate-binding protein n=1 Tax=Haladaptatus halobius TaxID=2884875 RepID=UPI001D0BD96B|nr:ABC transporter substrate-binding protein [Haladaptatus halobius]